MSLQDLERKIKESKGEEIYGLHIFSNKNRREVFRELTRLPCRTSSSIGKSLGMDARVVEWHLKKMKNVGFVDEWKDKRRYYYVLGLVDPIDLPFFKALNSKDARIIIMYAINGCRKISDIPVARSSFYRHVKLFQECGIIEVGGASGSYICPTEKLKKMVERYETLGMNYKREIVKKLEVEGFHVNVLGVVKNELKLEITGMENFNMGVFISPIYTAMEV